METDRRTLLAAGAILAASTSWAAAGDPVVATRAGKVRGARDTGVSVFRGIRYGADTAKTRFQPPAPPTPWSDVRDALSYGPSSPQRGSQGDGPRTSEDCLFLNVWTPAADRGRRPVMVYIHGGAYSGGSGSDPQTDGRRLAAAGDVVVVSLNHRLNVFGYLYLARLAEGFADSGNAGQLDLVLALRWVRDNIASFGGDPGNVTLFGQSGGGAKIATLMGMKAASGLFHRAITMSGQQVTAAGPLNATARARSYLTKLGADADPRALLAMPAARLVDGLSAVDPIIGGGVYMGPVLDERSLDRHPFWPDANPLSAHLPMILGNTHDETRGLIGRSEPAMFSIGWADLPAALARHTRADLSPDLVVATYRRLYPAYSPADVFFAATTAGRSWRGQVEESEARAKVPAKTWVYQLNFKAPAEGGKWGAFHALDIPLAFGTLDAAGSLTGTGDDAHATSAAIQSAFLRFARQGDADWPTYTLAERATMIFDATSRVENDPRGAERRLFAKVPFTQSGT